MSTAPEVLYSGAFGSGKSRGLCVKLLTHAIIYGNLVGLCRKTAVSLKETTLRTLLQPDGLLPPVLPEGTYEHNKSDHIISLYAGGQIYYFGFDDPQRLGSLNLGAVGIDEGVELEEDEYTMLLGRLRNSADPHRQVFTATNPAHPSHFLHRRFYEESDPSRKLIETTSLENIHLPADYQERLAKFIGADHDRYVLGKWTAYEGLVYSAFNRTVHLRKAAIEAKWRRTVLGIDEGFTNPAVILAAHIDGDGRWHISREVYVTGMRPTDFVDAAKRMAQEVGASDVFVDPSAAGLIADLQSAGLNAMPADNDVLVGIREVQKALELRGDSRPGLTIDPFCVNTIREIESYHWRSKTQKDEPVKTNDHAMDTLRYILQSASSKSSEVFVA